MKAKYIVVIGLAVLAALFQPQAGGDSADFDVDNRQSTSTSTTVSPTSTSTTVSPTSTTVSPTSTSTTTTVSSTKVSQP